MTAPRTSSVPWRPVTARPRRRATALAAAAACLTLASAACASTTSTPPATHTSGIVAQVPAAIRDSGELLVATDASYAPNEFIAADGHTITGMDADLAEAIGRVLGLKTVLVNVSFDQLITGLAAGRYDIAMSSLTDTKARQQAVDMVTYFNAGNSFVVLRSSGLRITGFGDLCGRSVAIEAGSTYVQQTAAEQPLCARADKPRIQVQTYADQASANLALLSHRAQVTLEDSPVAAYQQRQDHRLLVTGKIFGAAPYGIAIPKNSGLAQPILQALRQLIHNGTYQSITARWGISTGDITDPVLNGATG